MFIYGISFFSILSFSLFISSLVLNRLYTIAFIFIGELAAQATNRGSTALKNVMESFPFYLATDGFNQPLYSILILIAFSVVMYGVGVFVFQKRDLL